MNIKVDIREKVLIKLLTALNAEYQFKVNIIPTKLDLGDVIIECDGDELLILERKKLSDLAASIRDGRYSEQSYRLNGNSLHNHNIIYLIEGNMSSYSSRWSKITAGTLYVSMFCLQYYKGFSLIRTFDVSETAEFILRIADKMTREGSPFGYYHDKFVPNKKKYCDVVSKVKKKNITPDNIGEIILSQIPGISAVTSMAIMKHFGSLYQLLEALKNDAHCMDTITYDTKKGQKRRISKVGIGNIIQYLLYQKSNVIEVST